MMNMTSNKEPIGMVMGEDISHCPYTLICLEEVAKIEKTS